MDFNDEDCGRKFWETYGPIADSMTPLPARLHDPDSWDPQEFADLDLCVHFPYEDLGLGGYPPCFNCKCNILPRHRGAVDAVKEGRRNGEENALQRKKGFLSTLRPGSNPRPTVQGQ